MTSAFQLQISPEGIAELIFNLPGEKVNKLSIPILEDLEKHIDQLSTNTSVKALKVTSGKEGIFVAGADLHSFEPAFEDPSIAEVIIKTGHRVFNKLSNLPFPSVAVINGACLGGGLELALSCTYRIASDSPQTKIGLPEVNLGLFPGWGGTQRLPRLTGLMNGLDMILGGKIVPGFKAWKLHIVDALAPAEFINEKADEFVKQILSKEGREKVLERRKSSGASSLLLEKNPIGRAFLFHQSRKAIMEKTKGRYPAPLIALEVIKETCTLPLSEGLKKEGDIFIANIPNGFILAKDLIALFFTQEAAKKDPGVPGAAQPRKVNFAAVIGAGIMGAGISWLLADHMIFTRVKDVSWELVGKGISSAKAIFAKGLKIKKLSRSDYERRLQMLSGTIDYSGFQHSDIIIEAATENLELKKKIFQEVEQVAKKDAIIASNTSSLTIAEMSEGMQHPERFVGMHFFNPVNKMPLVEVVGGKQTTPEAIATTVDLCKKLGKVPLVVGDCPGFLVNRIFMQGVNEIMLMLEEGYSIESIEKEVMDFGMPMKPFLLADEVGNDVSYKVAKTLEKGYGERMRSAKILEVMNERKLYGRKAGKGFYIYKGDKSELNPEVKEILELVKRPKANLPQEDILPRFIYSMVNEASRCLEEKVIERPDFLDLALIMGIGFPPFRGGLMRYADSVGLAKIVTTLKRFENELGIRFTPSALLEQKAKDNQKFTS